MLTKILVMAGSVASYATAAKVLEVVGELSISSRQVNKLTHQIGGELQVARDEQTQAYHDQPLPRTPRCVEPSPQLACVEVDGGRIQTRTAERGPGVHEAHWRETKNAGFFRMKTTSHPQDPHPQLPRCFANRKRMRNLLPGLEADTCSPNAPPKSDSKWRPEVLFRTCVSSLASSDQFGPVMAAEADARGFYAAKRRAYLGDGLAYNWSIQKKHFPAFEPIVDFVHPVERLYAAARAVRHHDDSTWRQYVAWTEAVWQGKVGQVIHELRQHSHSLGPPPDDVEESDPRRVLAETLTYLGNNQTRMDYPRYRREGLPVTSALIESLVKEINYRVKGTEKFWNDGPSGEAILQVRAAVLCDDDRLLKHICQRPGSPYARNTRPLAAAA